MNKIAPYGKAITGAIIACLSFLQPAIDDGLTAGEIVGAAVAFFTAGAVVWAIPNKDPLGEKQDESVQPPSDEDYQARGYGSGV